MLPLQEGLVYGPVRSRRLGRSLGLNILPRQLKVCSFNCSYCQYGWTASPVSDGAKVAGVWPDAASVVKAAARGLASLRAHGETVDRITFAGNGEPTLHPDFPTVVAAVRAMRDEVAPGLPLAILSNSSTLGRPEIADALGTLDERYMKLDAGDSALLHRINAARIPFEEILEGLVHLRDVVIQSMFVKDRLGRVDNAHDLAVSTWIAALKRIAPRAVHIYSIDRPTAWPYLQAVPVPRLEEIGNRARAAGLIAVTFGPAAHVRAAAG